MRLPPKLPPSGLRKPALGWQAFTLVELMLTMGIFSLATLGLITLHLFGQRQDQLVQSKLGASDQSRRAFDRLTEDIRAAKIWRIGNGEFSDFTAIPNGTAQQGNAVRLQLTTAPSNFRATGRRRSPWECHCNTSERARRSIRSIAVLSRLAHLLPF